MRAILQRATAAGMMLASLTWAIWTSPLQAQEPADLPAIFDLVPADADMVIVVPSLSALHNGLGLLNNALDMGAPMLADPLGEFKRTTGMNRGLHDDGALAVAIMGLQQADQDNEPDVLMFVPVANYADFLSNFDAKAEDDLTQIRMPGGHIGWSRQVGDHAVLGRNQQLLAGFQPGQARDRFAQLAGRQASQYLAGSHIAMVLDPRPLLQRAQMELRQAVGQMEQNAQAAAAQFYDQALTILARDTQGLTLAGEIQQHGINVTGSAQFQAGSQVAGYFGPGRQAVAMTDRLPNQPFLMASAWDAQAINISQMLNDTLDALEIQDGWFVQLMQTTRPMLEQIRSAAQAYYVPQQMGFGASMFASVTVMDVGDGNAYLQAYRNLTNQLNDLRIDMGVPGQQEAAPNMPPPVMTFNATYTENALQVDGIRVDQYQVNTNLPPQLMAEMGQMAGMLMMMGGLQQTGYIAAQGQYVVMTSTPDAQLIRAGLNTLQNPAGLGQQETLTQVRTLLSPQPAAEMFISVSGIAQTVNQFMQMMMPGQFQPIQVPADLPPVGQSITTGDAGITSRLHVPMPVITFVGENTRRLMQRQAVPADPMLEQNQNEAPF